MADSKFVSKKLLPGSEGPRGSPFGWPTPKPLAKNFYVQNLFEKKFLAKNIGLLKVK
jgi:hypothetical protein